MSTIRDLAMRRVKPPHGDAADGYKGIGTSYDSYGNPTKGQNVEKFYAPGTNGSPGKKPMYSHVMGGKYGPAKRSFRGVSN